MSGDSGGPARLQEDVNLWSLCVRGVSVWMCGGHLARGFPFMLGLNGKLGLWGLFCEGKGFFKGSGDRDKWRWVNEGRGVYISLCL